MNSYSQNGEDRAVLNFFNGLNVDLSGARLLDVGANDGKTLSNSLLFHEAGWSVDLVEPSPAAFAKLSELYFGSPRARLFNVALSSESGRAVLHHSGPHLSGDDVSLLSTLVENEKKRWLKEKFEEVLVDVATFGQFWDRLPYFYITIDAEGKDWEILSQIDLKTCQTMAVCVEHNSDYDLYRKIVSYCAGVGLKNILLTNSENVICTI